MNAKTITLIVRLLKRPEGLRTEVKHLRTGEKQLIKSSEDLFEYFQSIEQKLSKAFTKVYK